MVLQMLTLMELAAEQLAQKVWEVGALNLRELEGRELGPGQVVILEILMIQDTGHVTTAHLPMSSQLPCAKCASNAVELIFQSGYWMRHIWCWLTWLVEKSGASHVGGS